MNVTDLLGDIDHYRDSSFLLHIEGALKAANLRVQRIDIRNRRRMFRPTAEIARLESSKQMSKQCVFEALSAARRIHGRWLVRKDKK